MTLLPHDVLPTPQQRFANLLFQLTWLHTITHNTTANLDHWYVSVSSTESVDLGAGKQILDWSSGGNAKRGTKTVSSTVSLALGVVEQILDRSSGGDAKLGTIRLSASDVAGRGPEVKTTETVIKKSPVANCDQ